MAWRIRAKRGSLVSSLSGRPRLIRSRMAATSSNLLRSFQEEVFQGPIGGQGGESSGSLAGAVVGVHGLGFAKRR